MHIVSPLWSFYTFYLVQLAPAKARSLECPPLISHDMAGYKVSPLCYFYPFYLFQLAPATARNLECPPLISHDMAKSKQNKDFITVSAHCFSLCCFYPFYLFQLAPAKAKTLECQPLISHEIAIKLNRIFRIRNLYCFSPVRFLPLLTRMGLRQWVCRESFYRCWRGPLQKRIALNAFIFNFFLTNLENLTIKRFILPLRLLCPFLRLGEYTAKIASHFFPFNNITIYYLVGFFNN